MTRRMPPLLLTLTLLATGQALAGSDAPKPPSAPSGPVVPAPRVKAETFRSWFDTARAGRLDLPPVAVAAAKGYQFVFIGGFWNESARGYFLQNARDLESRGVATSRIHFIFPSSHATLDENASHVEAQLKTIAKERAEPLVLIGHSRGACDALAFGLRHPGFVRAHVAAMFLVQGPFGGSVTADHVLGDGPPLDQVDGLKPRHRAVASLITRYERNQLSKGQHNGLTDLTRDGARTYWADLVKEHRASIPELKPKVYFLTTTSQPGRHAPFQSAAAHYVAAEDGLNDGLVATTDQAIPGLGTIVQLSDVGHTDLTNRFPTGRPIRKLRTALVDGILMTLANGSNRNTDRDVIPTRLDQTDDPPPKKRPLWRLRRN
ncbi:MAG: hypothetical protein U0794_17155 [Isosphaeraceae bacterium]